MSRFLKFFYLFRFFPIMPPFHFLTDFLMTLIYRYVFYELQFRMKNVSFCEFINLMRYT